MAIYICSIMSLTVITAAQTRYPRYCKYFNLAALKSGRIRIEIYFYTFNFGASKLHKFNTQLVSNKAYKATLSKQKQLILSDTTQT